MAIKVRCFLDDLLLDDEPIGLAQIVLDITRDQDLHGIGHEASTSPLEFIGNGAQYLEHIKSTLGQKADTVFRVDMKCSDGEDYTIGAIEGKVNYSNYKTKCGLFCSVLVPIESASCEVLLKNRMDQGVDLDAIVTFNKQNGLAQYDDLNIQLELPTKELDYLTEGYVLSDDEPITINNQTFATRPNYGNVIAANFHQTELQGASIIDFGGSGGLSPQILWDERLINFPDPVIVNGRLKGSLTYSDFTAGSGLEIRIYLAVGEFVSGTVVGTFVENHLILSLGAGFHAGVTVDFDITIAEYDWNPVDDGTNGVYFYLAAGLADCPTVVVTFDPETHFKAETTKQVPPTKVPAYMLHETLSRITESITDNCCRVKSSYYGRTDSQPFAFDLDGCGGLRFVTSGRKVRNDPAGKFFANFKSMLADLQAIDNIGMGIEPDPSSPGNFLARIEDLDFFYQDFEMLRCPAISDAAGQVDATKIYSTVSIGYKKWETEANFGLDEYNANRIFRTSITSIQSKLDKLSGLIGGEYALEITREQQFASTNDADTRYDDEIFIVCLQRLNYGYGYPYGGLVVEQANIDDAAHIFSPGTTYNYRISPVRNLLRWFRSIMASYANITDNDNRLYFSEGTGNLQATGILADNVVNPCTLEKVPLSENQDIVQTVFENLNKATPLWTADTITFDYPMSIADYQRVKANPYGYVSFQCGLGDFEKGWLTNLKYQPFVGKANITLRKTWPGKIVSAPIA